MHPPIQSIFNLFGHLFKRGLGPDGPQLALVAEKVGVEGAVVVFAGGSASGAAAAGGVAGLGAVVDRAGFL